MTARVFCVMLALVGMVPVSVVLLARSPFLNAWVAAQVGTLLAKEKIGATCTLEVHLLPLEVELHDLKVAATDGGSPVIESARASVRPRLLALLSGKLDIDQIEVDDPKLRVVVENGEIKNLHLPPTQKKTKPEAPSRAPFAVVAVTSADLDVTLDGTQVVAHDVDVDVTRDDAAELATGITLEVAVRAGDAWVRRPRALAGEAEGKIAYDEDVLCALDTRLRYDPSGVLVRRLDAAGFVDLAPEDGTRPACTLPPSDPRRVEAQASQLSVALPTEGEASFTPRIDGHLRVRAPLALASRFVAISDLDGWVGFDGDLRYSSDSVLPEVAAHIEGHGLRLERYRLAEELASDLVVHRNVITSPLTSVRIAGALAVLRDVRVEPLAKGLPLAAKLEVKELNFLELMRALGVSDHPHVAWTISDLLLPDLKGTLSPIHLDSAMTARSSDFSVADIAQDDPSHVKILGFRQADLFTHVAVRPSALEFQEVRAVLDRSVLEGGFVSIGFHNDLRVDVPHAHVDLADITPLAGIPLAGHAEAEAHLVGQFNDPVLTAKAVINEFAFGGLPFGNVQNADVELHGLALDLKNVRGQKGRSTYEMPVGRLDFGTAAAMQLDAVVTSSSLGFRDFLSIFALENDPTFDGMDAQIATRAALHVTLGGPDDSCGGGIFDVRATAHLREVAIWGEKFEDGDFDLDYRWEDRLAGLAGAEIEVRALSLHKSHANGKAPAGAVLGSGTLRRGGFLHASAVASGLPLFRVQALGAAAPYLQGEASAVAEIDGTLDDLKVAADVDVSPTHYRGVPLGASRVHLDFEDRSPKVKPADKTRCGGAVEAPQSPAMALERRKRTTTDLTVSADLFAGQIKLDRLAFSTESGPVVKGRVALRKLSLGTLTKVAFASQPVSDDDEPAEGVGAAAASDVGGEVTGDLVIARLPLTDLGRASIQFVPTALFVARGAQRVDLRPSTQTLSLEDDTLTIPQLAFDLQAPHGLRGTFALRGRVTRLTHEASLDVVSELSPMDLGLLVGVVPRIDRAAGTLSGSVRVGGRLRAPDVDGELRVRGGELAIKGLPSVVSELEVDVHADATQVKLTRAEARFAGGQVSMNGFVPLRGDGLGVAEAEITARSLHLVPADGVTATVDADLVATLNLSGSGGAAIPQVTGDVLLTQFDDSKAMSLTSDLGASVRAKRTEVDTYDPQLDAVAFELRLRSQVPLRIHNSLLEVSLGMDSGVLQVSGTNQRVGLRGNLRALPGGRLHFRASEFDLRQAYIRFDDPTRIAASVDVLAVTEYRRYTDTSAGAAAGAGTSGVAGSSGGNLWRISLHVFGDLDNLRFEMTSDPPLSQEDIVLLLTIGMTRAELDQLQAGSFGASVALEALATVSGADKAVKQVLPVIDDFRFGSAYSTRTGRTEPQVTVGKRLTDDVRATVTTSLTGDQDRELRSNIEWRLNQRVSVQGSYDNINDVSSSAIGNVGVDFRWRLEFQ